MRLSPLLGLCLADSGHDLSEEILDRKGNELVDYTIVVGGAASQKVYGVSSIDGDIKWTKSVGEGVNSVPVMSQEMIAYLTDRSIGMRQNLSRG